MARFIASHLTRLFPAHTSVDAAVLTTCSRARGYASEATRSLGSDGGMPSMAAQRMKSNAAQADSEKNKKKGFWMRDPATGDWIPEDHFGDIDVADLREKLLCTK